MHTPKRKQTQEQKTITAEQATTTKAILTATTGATETTAAATTTAKTTRRPNHLRRLNHHQSTKTPTKGRATATTRHLVGDELDVVVRVHEIPLGVERLHVEPKPRSDDPPDTVLLSAETIYVTFVSDGCVKSDTCCKRIDRNKRLKKQTKSNKNLDASC